ncbi:MAG: FG-GAP repeat domain-containing protein, partial [Candidatus Latescibacterota bacterium]
MDGAVDLYVLRDFESNLLYHNNNDGTFTDQAGGAGVNDSGAGRVGAWSDYDEDGYADVFVANDGTNFLYHNNGDGTFTEESSGAGVSGSGTSLAVNWVDYDGDAVLDLYVVNNDGANVLYHNNGNGTFGDVSTSSGLDSGFGVVVSDWAD